MSLTSQDPLLNPILDQLREKHSCHTAILYGSRARGDATPASDYDILGIRADGTGPERDARFWNGAYLDIFIYPEANVREPDESMLRLLVAEVLFERDGIGTRLLQQVQQLFDAGPKPLSPDEVQVKRVWAWKMLDRAQVGDIEGNYRRHWLLEALLEDYFRLRNQWYRGPKESLIWLEKHAPDVFEAFKFALEPKEELAEVEKLTTLVTGERSACLGDRVSKFPSFTTERLLLSPIKLDDADAYQKYFVDYEVIRHLSSQVPWPYPENGVVEFFKNVLLPDQGRCRWTWAIRLQSNPDEVIGCVDLWREGRPEHRGFWLGRNFWGHGYMTEAVTPVTAFAFESLGFESLVFTNAVGNLRSRRVKEKTGAQFIKVQPASFVDPTYKEQEVWRLEKSKWLLFKSQTKLAGGVNE